jgi:hypothetical protein
LISRCHLQEKWTEETRRTAGRSVSSSRGVLELRGFADDGIIVI